MTRSISGWLGLIDTSSEPSSSSDFAPFVTCAVEVDGESSDVDFLIDTGSDYTILMPTDADALLGSRFHQLDFAYSAGAVPIYGTGEESHRAVPLRIVLRFVDDSETQIDVAISAMVVEPDTPAASDSGNWAMPSILGRDTIWPGDLEFRYSDGTVTLIRPDGG